MTWLLWIVAALALVLAWTARKRAAALSERLDEARRQSSTKEADLAELKERFDVLKKHVEQLASGRAPDAMMVREGRLHRNTTAADLQRRIEAGESAYVIDVRSPQEWAGGHIPNAVHIPVDEIEKRLHDVRRDGVPMFLVCAGGGRSSSAAEFLGKRGFLNVHNVEGGMNAWRGPLARD